MDRRVKPGDDKLGVSGHIFGIQILILALNLKSTIRSPQTGLYPSSKKKVVIAGLDPAIHLPATQPMRQYFVYIMASKKNGTLYIGVTSNIARRAFEHREGLLPGFTKKYGVKTLVYAEVFDDVGYAIQRE